LDPQGIADIRNLVRHLSKDLGKTIFISSHLLGEMEQVADSLLIIHKGKKIAEGSLQELIHPENVQLEFETNDANGLADLVSNIPGAAVLNKIQEYKLVVKIKRTDVPELLRVSGEKNIGVFTIKPRHMLEDYFLSITAD
jgi:ABC-type multidrug transport system ATPase subunit